MIPQFFINEWRSNAPWKANEQVEQDLVISRCLVELFKNDWLKNHLAFRGGTAIHKLFLQNQFRYSEDIDLVQIKPEPVGNTIDTIKTVLSFLNFEKVNRGKDMTTLRFSFLSEFPPLQKLKIKIEINCREHLNVLGFKMIKYKVNSEWYKEKCEIRTYKIEEMLGTKLRALYQRKKGRDLYDIFKALKIMSPDRKDIISCYKKYMHFSGGKSPSAEEFEKNLRRKLSDSEFLGDIKALIRPDDDFNSEEAYFVVLNELVKHI